MNSTGCPYLQATDEAFQAGVPGSCDTSIVGFYVYTMLIATCSMISGVKQYSNWIKRPRHTSKIPRGPINQFLLSSLQFIGAALTGTNLINYHNGLTFSMISMIFLNFAYAYSLGLVRLVRLGEKIIPRSRRPIGEETSAKLGRFDAMGKVLLALQLFSLVSGSIVLIFLSPILTSNEDIISRLGWGLKGSFVALCQFGYWYQFERCIRTIKSVQAKTADILVGDPENQIRTMELDFAVWKMRKNQLVHFTGSFAATILILLTAAAIPANVYVVYSTYLAQCIGALIFEFNVKAVSGNRVTDKSSSNPNKNLNNKVMMAQQSLISPPGISPSNVKDSEADDLVIDANT